MPNNFKSIVLCLIAILVSLNFVACSKDNIKISEATKVTTQELTDANLELFCKVELTSEEIDSLEEELKSHKSVSSYKTVTKEEQTKKSAKLLGIEKLFESEDVSIFPASFIVKLKDVSMVDSFYNEFQDDSRIDKIKKINIEKIK